MDWMTVGRLGELADALEVSPVTLLDALDGAGQDGLRREAERVGNLP